MQSGNASYIIRWGQEVTNPDGTIGLEKWQAFVSGIVASSPAPSLEVGQSGSSDITINVSRYRLVHNDVNELFAIDRIAGILRINRLECDAIGRRINRATFNRTMSWNLNQHVLSLLYQ